MVKDFIEENKTTPAPKIITDIGRLEKWAAFSTTGMMCLAILSVGVIVNLLAAIFIVNLIKHLVKLFH